MLVSIENISKSYGSEMVLSGINARILEGDKIGVVGSNGAGKTTLLRIIAGELTCDEGNVVMLSHLSVGYQRQNSELCMHGTVLEELISPFKPLYEAEKRMNDIMNLLENDSSDTLMQEYTNLEQKLIAADWYSLDYRINIVMNGVGLSKISTDKLVSELSGGEQTMLMLAKLLLISPKLLILDEPTNHLDMNALAWLESYLKQYSGAVLVVSHDRFFLDKVCNKIWSVSSGKLYTYTGNYTEYQNRYRADIEREEKLYRQYLEKKQQLEDFIAKNIVRASTTKQAQSRRKELEKMEQVQPSKLPLKPPKLRLAYTLESAQEVLELKNFDLVAPSGKVILSKTNLLVRRSDRLAIIGGNGTGKTTLLKMLISGKQPTNKGRIEWGRGVRYSYYEQGSEGMDLSITVLESLHRQYPLRTEHELRSVLGAMGLRGEMVHRLVGELSGGERARLKLSAICMSDSNVLILDEPTNHLDLSTKEVLEEALIEYTGTIIMVSHDRYLLDRVATRILWLHDGVWEVIEGGYSKYLDRLSSQTEAVSVNSTAKATENSHSKQSYTGGKQARRKEAIRRKAISDIEKLIADLENRILEIDEKIFQPEISSDYIKLTELCDIRKNLEQELAVAMDEWTSLED